MKHTEVPEPWRSAMQRVGRTSLRRMADAADLSPETVRRIVHGYGVATPESISALARALNEDVRVVASWAQQSREVIAPYKPPAEADHLDERQRRALDELIRSMVKKVPDAPMTPTPADDAAADAFETERSIRSLNATRKARERTNGRT